jgi:hypothetical protein
LKIVRIVRIREQWEGSESSRAPRSSFEQQQIEGKKMSTKREKKRRGRRISLSY